MLDLAQNKRAQLTRRASSKHLGLLAPRLLELLPLLLLHRRTSLRSAFPCCWSLLELLPLQQAPHLVKLLHQQHAPHLVELLPLLLWSSLLLCPLFCNCLLIAECVNVMCCLVDMMLMLCLVVDVCYSTLCDALPCVMH
jgi:hypothetical protein